MQRLTSVQQKAAHLCAVRMHTPLTRGFRGACDVAWGPTSCLHHQGKPSRSKQRSNTQQQPLKGAAFEGTNVGKEQIVLMSRPDDESMSPTFIGTIHLRPSLTVICPVHLAKMQVRIVRTVCSEYRTREFEKQLNSCLFAVVGSTIQAKTRPSKTKSVSLIPRRTSRTRSWACRWKPRPTPREATTLQKSVVRFHGLLSH